MIDGTNLNQLTGSRQLLRAFGGINETYSCSEAELSAALNFSGRGFPALQTRALRKKVRDVEKVNGMYHLNGLLICRGTGLEYAPDGQTGRTAAVTLENVLTDDRKALAGMGSKVLIWPDRLAFDTETGQLETLGAKWELGDRKMTVCPCDTEGKVYEVAGAGDTEPESPEDGQLFLKGDPKNLYDYESVLEKWSAKSGKWVQVLVNTVRMTCPGIGSLLKEGDTVTLTGMPQAVCDALAADLNGEIVVQALEGDDLVASLCPPQGSSRDCPRSTVTATGTRWRSLDGARTENEGLAVSITLERRVPELDFVTEQGNRVWGCSKKENTIYACRLGDPTNWYSYRGIAADSYAVSVGSDGTFTGAASCMGYVLFFKENCIHKLYGSKPSDYQLSSVRGRGVAANAAHSLCVLNETLYYLSPGGVMAWDGSLPSKVSGALDTGKLTGAAWCAAGSLDARYYLYLRRQGDSAGRLLVYDTERGLWHEESAVGYEMASTGQQLYLWDGRALWAADPDRETEGEAEAALQFEAVSGDIGLTETDDKYISRITLRLDAQTHSVVTLAVSYDGGPWETLRTAAATGDHARLNLPFEPRRHDTLRLKLSGTGQIALRSMAFTLAGTTGGRVTGVEIDASGETPELGGTAAETLADQLTKAGSTAGVDAVSGATLTSNAVFTAMDSCLAQAGTGSAGAEDLTDGTYTSSAKGCLSDVEVTVTVSGGKVSEVAIDASGETPELGGAAAETLADALTKAGSTNGVDAVSGATLTSEAVFTAMDDCLSQAQ